MKRIAALAFSVTLLTAQTDRGPQLSVTAIRHWSLPDVTRVAIEVSGRFDFRTDRLHNPERVYFDVVGARPRIDGRRLHSEAVDDRLLTRIRAAETNPGTTRVVLDLAGPVRVSTSVLSNPSRLMVELRAEEAPAGSVTETASLPPQRPVEPPAASKTAALAAPSERTPAEPPKTPPAKRDPTPQARKSESPAPVPVEVAKAAPPEPVKTARREPEKAAAPKTDPSEPPSPAELAKAAKRTSNGGSSLIRTLGLKVSRVVIDPGHGGHDQGTEGPHGLLEKELVLDIARRVGKLIEEQLGAEVIYTRTDDTFIPLEGRTALANERKADLFLSIHANSSPLPRVAGIETFYLNLTGTKDALDVAARENASSQKSIFDLADLAQKIAKHEKTEESREFAARIQTALYAFSARNVPGSRNRGVKSAPFVVLVGASMPSVLAEIGFISNSREEALLKKSEYRQRLAEALFRGVSRYADSLSHFQVAVTPPAAPRTPAGSR